MRITPEQLLEGHRQFVQRERRDAMYKVATRLVEEFWGKPSEVAEGLGVLLLVWNAACYRHGSFDFDELEKCIKANQDLLTQYRHRNILGYTPKDDAKIGPLFEEFLVALQICEKKCKGRRTPVGVAKALHLLAPNFFPLWDKEIAVNYGCDYAKGALSKYLCFFGKTKDIAEQLEPDEEVKSLLRSTGLTLLKLIDEFNYVTFTLPGLRRKAEQSKQAKLKKKAGR